MTKATHFCYSYPKGIFTELNDLMFKKLIKPGFAKDVATLMSGTTIARGLGILSAPIITRLYLPEDYGVLAIFISIVSILTPMVCGRYEFAIVLPKKDSDATNLLVLSIAIMAGVSIIVMVCVVFVHEGIATAMNAPQLSTWLWLVPLTLVLSGLYRAQNYWSTRRKLFKLLAVSGISQTVTRIAYQISAAFFTSGVAGLVQGYVLGQAIGSSVLGASVLRADGKLIRSHTRARRVISLAHRYRAMPKYILQTTLLNSVAKYSLPFILSFYCGPGFAGLFALSQRIIVLPSSLLADSLWQVTHAKIGRIEELERKGDFLFLVHRFVSYIFAFPFMCIAMFSHTAYSIFGDKWNDLEFILPPLAALLYMNTVSNATSYFTAFRMYRAEAYFNLILIGVSLGSLVLSVINLEPFSAIRVYALFTFLIYLIINMFWAFHVKKICGFIWNLIGSITLSFFLILPIRFYFGHKLIPCIILLSCACIVYYVFFLRRVNVLHSE